eukprot:CAMPEP_0177670354 /NCGR_PEP_ID=MMETSP0447-20121125/24033_1 /TAXON_ID=0 /ORGANISM="Stygamoeba regulata, Strain BSH-02190019" /LENGTH=226 /DNA_ID=CAMNT_0019177489 /DNA_START=17 /DNA_END=694 /DNA_ORIENTATION=-
MADTAPSAEDLQHNLNAVRARIAAAASKHGRNPPQLVAVSKTKPAHMVRTLLDAGHTRFGENYVQEMVEKSRELPEDIQWHFIGHLQSNKCKIIAEIPNLVCVEGVDSFKLAAKLNAAVAAAKRPLPLDIFVQVNSSGEESKSGVEPSECEDLIKKIKVELPNLRVCGIMTIGAPNPGDIEFRDFKLMASLHADICARMGFDPETFHISMGMSSDYEDAIAFGATN